MREVIAAIVAEMREAQNGYSGHHASGTFRRLAERLEATLPAAEPADAGRLLDLPTASVTFGQSTTPYYTAQQMQQFALDNIAARPPSEAAARSFWKCDTIGCGISNHISDTHCARCHALNSQPARSQG